MKKVLACWFIGLFIFCASSCEDELISTESSISNSLIGNVNPKRNSTLDKFYDDKSNLVREFGFAFAAAMNESVALRNLVKTEALKMFDEDYEVLYFMIQDEPVEENQTVEELLSKYLYNKQVLSELERQMPTLTILVPVLPDNSFSAESWDVQTEVPSVAVRLSSTNDVPFISPDGEEIMVEAKYSPGFPVLVLKESERVISEANQGGDEKQRRGLKTKRGLKFKFVDSNFDAAENSKGKNLRTVLSSELDSKVKTAYDIYKTTDGWQRDYIYYNITPSKTRGEFDSSIEEQVAYFTGKGDANAFYAKIADNTSDPQAEKHRANGSSQYWTDGFFEFKLIGLVGDSAGYRSIFTRAFSVNPRDLFVLHYKKTSSNWFGKDWYELDYVSYPSRPKRYEISLFSWDLESYPRSVKLTLYEIDPNETKTTSVTGGGEFATNFEVSETVKKVGLKFGASTKITNSQSYNLVVTDGDDPLGDVAINFGDKVIYSDFFGMVYGLNEYHFGGYCSMTILPTKKTY